MRKMTKTVAVLAAMSAMTVASASMAFAATGEVKNLSALDKAAAAQGANTGEWDGDDVNGWTFTPTGESKLKGTWAQIDNVWYYFDKDGIMAQEELLYLEGETYYFNADGSMMADGWVGFDYDSDVVYDYDLDVTENVDDIINPVFEDAEDAYETVWMYFNEDGTAKDDEWYKAESGLWYRFDDIIMVCGDFDHIVGDDVYGFDENGAMLVGWAENYNDLMKTAPNKDERVWYYYDSNGKKFVADKGAGYGWKKIDGNWYCFEADGLSVGTLIVNAYFKNSEAANGNSDFYYVDKKGVMATGVVTVDKEAVFVDGDDYTWATNKKIKNVSEGGKAVEVFFDKSSGKAKSDTWNGNNFYAAVDADNIWEFDTDDTGSMAVSAYADVNGNAVIKGALVKSSFIEKDDNYYYVDKYGDKVVNTAIEVGNYNIANDTFTASVEAASKTSECKAFVLFNGKGEAYDVDADRTVKVGSKKYIATTEEFNGMQVFYYENNN